ncbi:hypothetical protein AB0M95_36245 [Sphaerisporangium sp. NPDC051017]|uniref:hypothetical protein n=1 Tax=Sphaerisporangium sp. NPDC051017 TaxID=3154636 RepID=UPI00341AFB41
MDGGSVKASAAMTTAQRIRATRLSLSRGPDGRLEFALAIRGRFQFWDLARALAAWAATQQDVRDLPRHPGEQWALAHVRAVTWRYGHQRISSWSDHVREDDRSAVADWAYHAAWHLWGQAFDIPYSEIAGAMTQFPEPEYLDNWG